MFSSTVQRTKGWKKIQIPINGARNQLGLHISPTDHKSAVKMNELHSYMQNVEQLYYFYTAKQKQN